MQKNFTTNQISILLPKNFEDSSKLKWILALVSGICLFSLFYSSITNVIGRIITPTPTEQPIPDNKKPFTTNGVLGTASAQNVNTIVTDALAFYNMLSTTDQATLQQTYTTTLARKWSNLPCGISCRNGLQLGTNLTAAQYSAAMQIFKDALSSTANDGYDEFHQMNLAEAYLHANGGGSGYDSVLRWVCFLNAPSATGAWMLQFGGHHYAANIAFNNGHVIGATPFFMGLEPKTFTYNSVAYDPLGDERNALAAMLASLSTSQLATAKINSTFNDCVMIPGESNGGASSFPVIAIGQPCSSLTTAQQNLVLTAIQYYTGDMDTATANNVMAVYANEISQTYISYVGTGTSGNAASFLISASNYARISGPHVWIEFSCQNGIVIQGQIHYHTVWRDRSHDYGVDLAGTAIDVSSGLPLSWLNFTATLKDKNTTILNWSTASEINNNYFEIERCTDANFAQNKEVIGKVNGNGTTTTIKNYQFTDNTISNINVQNKMVYYRLRQVDFDGNFNYSKTIAVTLLGNTKTAVLIYPNPSQTNIGTTLPETVSNAKICVQDITGKTVYSTENFSGEKINLNVQAFVSGNYFLSIKDNSHFYSGKFVKQ